jgi:hypothetical protein
MIIDFTYSEFELCIFRVARDDVPWVYGYAMPACTWLKVGLNEPLTLAVSITAKVSLISVEINIGDFKNTA